jgi:hypothetical protein
MNPILIVALLAIVLLVIVLSIRGDARFLSSGGLSFLSVVCAVVFLGSGELNGVREMSWKIGAATVGSLSLLGALYMAWKKE